MTRVQFLQKERVMEGDGSMKFRPLWPYLFPMAEGPPDRGADCTLLLPPAQEKAGGLYSTPPPTKRTHVSYLLTPELIPPGSSLEEERSPEVEKPSPETPRQRHCFEMFRSAHFDDSDISGSRMWPYPLSYALNGYTRRIAYFWANVGSYRPKNSAAIRNCSVSYFLLLKNSDMQWSGLPMWSLSNLRWPLPLLSLSSPFLPCALETRIARGNNLVPVPSAAPVRQDTLSQTRSCQIFHYLDILFY